VHEAEFLSEHVLRHVEGVADGEPSLLTWRQEGSDYDDEEDGEEDGDGVVHIGEVSKQMGIALTGTGWQPSSTQGVCKEGGMSGWY
jgi:hypothetical protein